MPTPSFRPVLDRAPLVLALFLLAASATAQSGSSSKAPQQKPAVDQATLKARLQKKQKAPFLKSHPWHLSLEAARRAATAASKPILIYFTRSDVPAPTCAAVEAQLLAAPGFAPVAERVVLCCIITSGVAKAADQDLFERFGGTAFPMMAVTDASGNRIATLSRISSVADIQGVLDGEVADFRRLVEGARKGDKKAKAALFLRRLELGHLQPREIEKELETADYLSVKQRRTVRRSLANLEVMSVLNATDVSTAAGRKKVVQRFLEMVREGRIPSDRFAFPMWQVLIGHADIVEDPVLFRRSLDNIKRIAGKNVDEAWLTRMTTRLRALEFFAKRGKKERK